MKLGNKPNQHLLTELFIIMSNDIKKNTNTLARDYSLDELYLLITATGISILIPYHEIFSFLNKYSGNLIAIVFIFFSFLIIALKSFHNTGIISFTYGYRFDRSTLIIGIMGATITYQVKLNSIGIPVVLFLLSVIYIYLRYRILLHRLKTVNTPAPTNDNNTELPIQLPNEDKFNISEHAKYVAGLIRNGENKGIGVFGPFGCGKSSFINQNSTF